MHGDLFGNWPTFDPVAVHLNDACGTPRAVMILESQQTLMEFLRDLTTVILERAKASKATNVLADMTFEDPAAGAMAVIRRNVFQPTLLCCTHFRH